MKAPLEAEADAVTWRPAASVANGRTKIRSYPDDSDHQVGSKSADERREADAVRSRQLHQGAHAHVEHPSLDLLEVREREVVVLHDIHEGEPSLLPQRAAALA